MQKSVSPFVMVIFGATGDLTARKLLPALFTLYTQGLLPSDFLIMGVARRPFSDEEFRKIVRDAIEQNSKSKIQNPKFEEFLKNIFYEQGMFEEKELYEKITLRLKAFDERMGACITRFFYLATPPMNYPMILSKLSSSKLSEGCGHGSNKWTRVLIEKPFGKDLDTAKKLEDQLCHIFDEKQIYRIDHYLAKETLQNILFIFYNFKF
jgi:glucose-6-phosphate 1-dehydrogenase